MQGEKYLSSTTSLCGVQHCNKREQEQLLWEGCEGLLIKDMC